MSSFASVAALLLLGSAQAAAWESPAVLYADPGTTRSDGMLAIAGGTPATFGAVWTCNSPVGMDFGIQLQRTTDSGANWTVPITVNDLSTNAVASNPVLATDGGQIWVAAWTASGASVQGSAAILETSRRVYLTRSSTGGTAWSPVGTFPAEAGQTCSGVSLATDNQGRWMAVWEVLSRPVGSFGLDSELFWSISTDHAVSWSAPAPLSPDWASNSRMDTSPHVAADGSGTWVVAWQAEETSSSTGVSHYSDILVSKSENNGLAWSAPEPVISSRVAAAPSFYSYVEDDAGLDDSPRVATDGSAGWVIAWRSDDRLNDTMSTGGNILFARSTDDATTFSAPAALNSDAAGGSIEYAPDLGFHQGQFVAVWQSYEAGAGALRSATSTDGAAWGTFANVVAPPVAGSAKRPSLALNSSSGHQMVGWPSETFTDLGDLLFTVRSPAAANADWALFD